MARKNKSRLDKREKRKSIRRSRKTIRRAKVVGSKHLSLALETYNNKINNDKKNNRKNKNNTRNTSQAHQNKNISTMQAPQDNQSRIKETVSMELKYSYGIRPQYKLPKGGVSGSVKNKKNYILATIMCEVKLKNGRQCGRVLDVKAT